MPFPLFWIPKRWYSPTQAGDWRFLTGETVLPLFLFILFLNHSKLNNSVAVHTFTVLYNQHFYLISKHFITPKVSPFASLLIKNGKPGCHQASEGKLAWMMARTKQQTRGTQRRQRVMTAEGKFLNFLKFLNFKIKIFKVLLRKNENALCNKTKSWG